MDTGRLLLRVGLSQFVSAPNAELAQAELERLTGQPITDFAEAIATLLRENLIRDPIRLEDQALQCHWRLELTQAGVIRARTLTGA